jgi:hypothetical protein
MSDVATQVPANPDSAVQQPVQNDNNSDVNQMLASALWDGAVPKQPDAPAAFKREFGIDAAAAKAEWEALRKLKEQPAQSTAQEIQWANDESKRLFDLLKEGKRDDVREVLNQQWQIERLEKLPIENASQAAEVLKTNLQFKNKNLSPDDIQFMVEETYAKPKRPSQSIDEADEDYQERLSQWEQQVQRIERKMIIDAKLAQNELPSYKSQIVLPDIEKAPEQQSQPNQDELAAKNQQFMENFKRALESNYQNFKGFAVTAKDGDVQLPISYNITPEEQAASKQMLESFNVNEFLDQRWFDQNGNPNITQMQEDLYLLQNRDKILESIANEAAKQRYLTHLKTQNNINLHGVNPNLAPPASEPQKSESQVVAESIWKL